MKPDLLMVRVVLQSGQLPSTLDEAFWQGWLAAKDDLTDEEILKILKTYEENIPKRPVHPGGGGAVAGGPGQSAQAESSPVEIREVPGLVQVLHPTPLV